MQLEFLLSIVARNRKLDLLTQRTSLLSQTASTCFEGLPVGSCIALAVGTSISLVIVANQWHGASGVVTTMTPLLDPHLCQIHRSTSTESQRHEFQIPFWSSLDSIFFDCQISSNRAQWRRRRRVVAKSIVVAAATHDHRHCAYHISPTFRLSIQTLITKFFISVRDFLRVCTI